MPTQAPQEMPGAHYEGASDDFAQIMRLQQMRDRLASLSDEARSIRSQVPNEFGPDVERIQKQMQRLGERLAELGVGVFEHPAGPQAAPGATAIQDEVIMLGAPAKQDNHWDEASANALTRFYETNEAYFTDAASDEAQGAQAGRPAADAPRAISYGQQAPLDQRFAELAERIEQQLAQMHPENSLLTIGRRFDQLENRMASALRGVATRADLHELRGAEEQIQEINGQLEQFRRQLVRLDAIDENLGTLQSQLSEEKLKSLIADIAAAGSDTSRLEAIDTHLGNLIAQISPERFEGVADAAQKAMAGTAEMRAAQQRDFGEMRGLIENLISERRHNDENNASMLETMQQAIVRVLDRIDALEHGQGQEFAAQPASSPSMPPQSMPSMDYGHDAPQQPMSNAPAYEAPRSASFMDNEQGLSFDPQPQEGFATAPFDLEAAFATERAGEPASDRGEAGPDRRMDELRNDFIADAHRAKLKAASKGTGSAEPSLGAMMGGADGAKGDGDTPEKPRKRRSFFSFKSPRAMMTVLTLLAVIPAALFFMPRTPADAESEATVRAKAASQERLGAAGQTAPAAVAPATSPAQIPGVAPQMPFGMPDARLYKDVGAPGASQPAGALSTAALPDGITADADIEPAAQHLVRRFGAADSQTKPSSGMPQDETPAAQMREHILRQNGIAEGSQGLPPAMVGPFSLRLAAAKGDPAAQFEVGMRLADGKSPEQDMKQAAAWLHRSAEAGFPLAQFRLGTLYERGLGEEKDPAAAELWYTRAAEQGNVKAMHNLAVLMASKLEPDYAEAAKWFTAAAERGLADSQYNLAVLHENGLGVAKDDKRAYQWLLLAAKSGDAEAQKRRDTVKARLNDDDLAEVEAVAQSWRARFLDPKANDSHAAGRAWQQNANPTTRG
jgi:localization factor PodJL